MPAVYTLVFVIGMAIGAKSKNLQVAQATKKVLKSISGNKNLSLGYLHGNGLPLKRYVNCFKTFVLQENV